MKRYIFLNFLLASSLYAGNIQLSPHEIEIYKNQSFLISTSQVSLQKEGDLKISIPSIKNIEDTNIFIENLNCSITYEKELKIENQKIKQIKEKIKSLNFLLKTKQEELNTFKRINVDISNIDKVYEKYNKLLMEISSLKEKIERLKEKLSSLQAYTGKALKLFYKCSAPVKSYIRSFSPVNISGYQEYVLSGFTDKKKIKIDSFLILKNHTDISFKDITVKYHSFIKNPSIEPPPFKRPIYRAFQKSIAAAPVSEYKETFSKSYFFVKNVNLPKKETVKVIISSDVYPADFSIYIDGYATVTPFLVAKFKADQNLPSSFNGKFFIDGMFIGKGRVKSVVKGKENKIFFGEDVMFHVKKEKVEDTFERISSNKVKHTVRWKYYLENNHKVDMKAEIVDRLPKSSDRKKIEYFSDINWKRFTANGNVIWEVLLKPNQKLNFSFGYIEIYRVRE